MPLVANLIEGGKTPELTASDLQQLGFKIVFFPVSGLLAVTQAMKDCWQYLQTNGTTVGFKPIVDFQKFKQIIDLPKYPQLEQDFRD